MCPREMAGGRYGCFHDESWLLRTRNYLMSSYLNDIEVRHENDIGVILGYQI